MRNYDKLFDATAYILYLNDKSMNYTKLIKELYFADREALRQKGFSITGDKYYSMKEGPVLSSLLHLIKGSYPVQDVQNKWNNIFNTNKDTYEIVIKQDNFCLKSLSPNEEKILKSFALKFKEMDWKEVVDNYAHNPDYCPEWHKLTRGRKVIKLETIFQSLGYSADEIKIAVSENKYYSNK